MAVGSLLASSRGGAGIANSGGRQRRPKTPIIKSKIEFAAATTIATSHAPMGCARRSGNML